MTLDKLKTILEYDKDTGNFTWKPLKSNGRWANTVAGSVQKDGYIRIHIDEKIYPAHRLAWLYEYGEFPITNIDHIDHVKTNNKISNLRLADYAENQKNRSIDLRNSSGTTGVTFVKRSNKWQAQIGINKTVKYLGSFKNIYDSINARKTAEIELGFHANHGAK
jgi:hypothetical protein